MLFSKHLNQCLISQQYVKFQFETQENKGKEGRKERKMKHAIFGKQGMVRTSILRILYV